MAGQRGLPEDHQQREADAGTESGHGNDPDRCSEREQAILHGPGHHEQHADQQRARRPPAQPDERADHRAGSRHALEHAEHAGAAVDVTGDRWG